MQSAEWERRGVRAQERKLWLCTPTEVLPTHNLICQRLQSKAAVPATHPLLTASPTHSSQLRCSHPRHQHSPCHHHRASARGHTREYQDRRRRRGHKSCLLCEETQRDSGEVRAGWAAMVASLLEAPSRIGRGPPLTTVGRLIRAVPAVIATVTQPLLGDAPMVLALKLGLRAELVWNSGRMY